MDRATHGRGAAKRSQVALPTYENGSTLAAEFAATLRKFFCADRQGS